MLHNVYKRRGKIDFIHVVSVKSYQRESLTEIRARIKSDILNKIFPAIRIPNFPNESNALQLSGFMHPPGTTFSYLVINIANSTGIF